ncbi:hypothetical protein HYV64_04385 [Candidatus Shapirobacteria bacterium]|nr:hypothetical protein [Candidatus Shapirobacteria bacterium]
MSEYDQKTLLVIAQSLVTEGGYKGNPLMDKPEIRNLVNEILAAQKISTAETPSIRAPN